MPLLPSVNNMIDPYITWIKVGAVTLIAILLVSCGVWFKGVIAERDKLRLSEKAAKETIDSMLAQRAADIKLQGDIANAIKNIRVVSNNYISAIEDSPAPGNNDGDVVVLVAPGVSKTVPTVFNQNSSASRNNAATEKGGSS